MLSGIPARWTDELVLSNGSSHHWAKKTGQEILARAISTLVFPTFVAIDMVHHLGRGLGESTWALLARDWRHWETAKLSAEIALKCFLGLLASPLGVFGPDLVTVHFIPPASSEGTIQPYGSLYSSKGDVRCPKCIADVEDIVREAKELGKQISILGAKLSQGKHVLPKKPTDIVIDMKNLASVSTHPSSKTVTVGPGATWESIQRQVNNLGYSIKVMQASNIFSVGGSLSVNCHGWAHQNGSISNTIKELKVVDAEGKLRVVHPEDDLFKLILGGFGFFGVIVEAKIALAHNRVLTEEGEEVNSEDYAQYFQERVLSRGKDIALHRNRLSVDPEHLFETGLAVSYVKMRELPKDNFSPHVVEPEGGTLASRFLFHVARRFPICRSLYWRLERRRIMAKPITTRNEAMRPPIKAAFNNSKADVEWLQEYFVKGDQLAPFLKVLAQTLKDHHVNVFNASVRYVKKEKHSALPYAAVDRFAIVLFFNQSLAPEKIEQTQTWVRKIIDYLADHEGTYYLPYQHFATREQFLICYPQWGEFLAKKEEYDPQHVFENGFTAEYLK